jgi:hypothetical protein
MSKFTNPLENIKIASPCKANWEEMFGNERKRFCGDCKLNVYNLSGMTQREAENVILQSEGRLCVRFYKRADGSILTKDCPVGWQAIKRRVSKTAAAFASLVFAALSGVGLGNYFAEFETETHRIRTIAITNENYTTGVMAIDDSNVEAKGKPMMGNISVSDSNENIPVAGGLTNVREVRQQIEQKRLR